MMAPYPNPAQDELGPTAEDSPTGSSGATASNNSTFSYSIKLYDASGDVRKTGKSNGGKMVIKIDDLPNGQYYLHITTDMQTISSQVIIKR